VSVRQLERLFEIDAYAFGVNVKGLSHEDSLVQPPGGGNCLNWVAAHIVASRTAILVLLGEEPVWDQSRVDRFKRGSRPVSDHGDSVPFETIVADFQRSQERIKAGFARATDEGLEQKRGEDTVADKLHFLQFHEAYHIGQAGLLRRMAGKECAIP
jgi:DinB family protein